MEFKFKGQQTDKDRISDMVYAAMETGNQGQARLVLAEHRETFPEEVAAIRRDVQRDYGVRL